MTGAGVDAHVVLDRGGFRLDATIVAEAGEVVAVMGPSGAGKSTLLGALAGLVRPTGGRIRVGERTVDEPGRRGAHVEPMRRGVVLLGQEPRLFPHLTAGENVAFSLRTHGTPRRAAQEDAEAWLRRVGLPDMAERRPAELSGGQQQRVALARALAADPRAVLLDEPLTSLDAETAADIRTVLAEQLVERRATAILVTHDALDAAALAARLVVLERGVVTQSGPTREVLARPATSFTAAIAGLTLLVGVADAGAWRHAGTGVALHAQDAASVEAASVDGAALAAVLPPSAVRLSRTTQADAEAHDRAPARRDGGAADAWPARIVRLEATLGGVRAVVRPLGGSVTGALDGDASDGREPATLAAELAAATAADLGLAPGVEVSVRIDPAEVRLFRI